MEKRQDKYYLYLRWPRYLAQWFAHEMYRLKNYESETLPPFRYDCDVEPMELDVVETRRGSIERIIIEQCLAKQPEAIPKPIPKDATICILIPEFLGKPTQYYNYLPPSGESLLEITVRNHFRMELVKYMNKVIFNCRTERGGYAPNKEKFIETFMEINGIDYEHKHTIAELWRKLYKQENRKINSNKK